LPFATIVLSVLMLHINAEESSGTSLLEFLNISIKDSQNRPAIHTFIYGENPKESFEKDELIRIWAEAWAGAGWNPIILTEKDVMNHPEYQQHLNTLNNAKLPEYRWNRFMRYIAMSHNGGGWYSEPYILPMRSDLFDGKGFDLPNEGNFTMHTPLLPELLSGNQEAWMKLTFLMMVDPHNNDAMILQHLVRDNKNLYHVEDSIADARYLLDAKLKFELCDLLDHKIAAKFSYQIAQRAGFTRKQYYDAVTSSLKTLTEKCTIPKMHTFFEPAYDKVGKLLEELEGWKKAWKDAGWRPVVLTMEDAKKHPDFKKFEKAFKSAEYKISKYDQMCFYRWLAMAVSGGGWMSDYDTFPLFLDAYQDGLTIPNEGKLTSYARHVPCLVSGSAGEWNRVSQLVLFSYLKHSKEFWSDMLALEEIQRNIQGTMNTNEVITADDPYKDANHLRGSDGSVTNPFALKELCSVMQGKRAIHFSHASCDRAGFCHNKRSETIPQWINSWKEQCLISS